MTDWTVQSVIFSKYCPNSFDTLEQQKRSAGIYAGRPIISK